MMRNAISAIMMALCMGGAAAAADQKPPRLAVLASDDKQSQAIMALVEVSLSMRDDVEIIDRSHIDRILAEHRLQSKNMVSNEDRLLTARLLGCDVFADIRAFGTGEDRSLIMRALNAHTGARLIDVSVDLGLSLEEQAKFVAVAIGDALEKVKSGEEGNGVPVCIGQIREVGLPLAYRHLPEVVKPLLERYLLMSPTISVLERERLGLLNREAEIAEDTRSQLLASAVVIDIDVSTTMEGRLRLRASMSNVEGKEEAHATVEGEWNAYGSALLELVHTITRELKTSSIDLSAEALWRDAARYLYFSSPDANIDSAIALGEAALAREPSNKTIKAGMIGWYQTFFRRKYTTNQYVIKLSVPLKKEYSLAALARLERCMDIFEMGSHDSVMVRSLDCNNGRVIEKEIARDILPIVIITEGLLVDEEDASRLREVRQRILSWHRKTRTENKNVINGPLLVAGTSSINQLIDELYYLWKKENVALPRILDRYVVEEVLLKDALAWVYPGTYGSRGERSTISNKNKMRLMEIYAFWAFDNRIDKTSRLSMHFVCLRWAFVNRKLFEHYDDIITKHLAAAKNLVLEDHKYIHEFGRHVDRTKWGERVPKVNPMIESDRFVKIMRELLVVMRENKMACPDLLGALDWYDTDGADYPGMYLDEAIAQQQDHQHEAFSHRSYRWATGQRNFNREGFISSLKALKETRYGEKSKQEVAPINVQVKRILFAFPGIMQPGDDSSVRDKINLDDTGRILAAEIRDHFIHITLVDREVHRIGKETYHIGEAEFRARGRRIGVMSYDLKTGEMLARGSMPMKGVGRVKAMHMGERTAYMPTDRGVVVLPLDGTGEGWVLDEALGLPAGHVDAVCEYRGRLYIACNRTPPGRRPRLTVDCYLVTCNLDGSDIKVLATNARKEKLSPLDSMGPFIVNGILADTDNHRLIFPTYGDLWAYDIETGEIEKLAKQIQYPLLLGKNKKGDILIQEHYPGLIWSSWSPEAKKKEWMAMRTDSLPVLHEVKSEELPVGFPLFDDVFIYTVSGPARLFGNYYPPTNETKWELCKMKSNRLDFRMELPPIDAYAPFFLMRYGDELIACTRLGLYAIDAATMTALSPEDAGVNAGAVADGDCELSVVSEVGNTLTLDGRSYNIWPNRPLHWRFLKAEKHNITLDWCGRTWGGEFDLNPGKKTVVTGFPDEKPEKTFVLDMGQGVSMKFAWVPAGECSTGRIGEDSHEKSTVVRVEKGFWMGQFEVTVNQYQRLVEQDKPICDGDEYPVVGVSWEDAGRFCEEINKRYGEQLRGKKVRLPRKPEWEYAFWAGTKSPFYFGGADDGWDMRAGVSPVGSRMPNHFWLYDMLGNAREWCNELDDSNKVVGTFSPYLTQLGYEETHFPKVNGIRLVIENQ